MKRAKSTKFSHQYSEIIDESAEEVGISALEGEVIIDEHFRDIKEMLEDCRAPSVSINNILVFRPAIWKIRRMIYRLIQKKRDNKMGQELFETELLRLWKIKTRMYEETSRDRQSTYYKWKNRSADRFIEEIKNRDGRNK